MANFIKIAIFFFLSALSLIFLLIYNNTGKPVFAAFGSFSFTALIIISIAQFFDEFMGKLTMFRRRTRRNTRSGFSESKDIIDQSWNSLIEEGPIPAIIFNNSLEIKKKNRAFLNMLKNNSLNPDAKKLENIFTGEFEALAVALTLNPDKVTMGDAKLNNYSKSPFIFYFCMIGTDGDEKIYLAQFVDNTEKIDLKEKFIQAQKMQAVGQLSGGIAHDFNNILTAIIGFCDLLLTKHAPGDASFVDIMHIKQNANRAANLVRQLLAFSRKQTMQMEVLNIGDVLSEISNLTRRLIGENISLAVNSERNIWDIKADKSQLEQVLVNLAVNARDAMKDGGVLDISCRNVEIFSPRDVKPKYHNMASSSDIQPGKYVKISFSDTGSGIPADNLKKIFEPFFTTKEIGRGTGLGLATVLGIIEQSDGYIYVSSEENSGTEFLIFLNRYERTSADIKNEEAKKERTKDLTGTGTVLIVEDEEAVRMFSTRALKNKGYNVIEAFSGENAIEVIEAFGGDKIDLIISDVVMPGISGPEFVEQISPKFPNIKVVFVSGYGEDAFYQKYGTERKFNFLAKPYSLNQLAERVKELLG